MNVSKQLKKKHAPLWTEPPGGILVWIIVLVELLTFGMGLVVFQVQASEHRKIFEAGRSSLNQPIGMINTMILLTGGWFMTIALQTIRSGEERRSQRWLTFTILSGVGFMLLKLFEYAEKLNHGYDLHADTFFTLYWLLTVFHFIHVAIAVVILSVMWYGIHRGKYTAKDHEDVESSGVFWHMCDLIWLFVYPVVYLL